MADLIAIAPFVVAAVVVVVVCYRWPQRRRAAQLRQLAEEIGWEFSTARDFRHDNQYAALSFFRKQGGMARNTLWGSFEIAGVRYPAKAGDFVQIDDSVGRHARVRREFTYLIVHLPLPGVPDYMLEPSGSSPRPGDPLGDGELAYERGDFRREFARHTDSPQLLDRILDADMQRMLLALRGPTFEVSASRLCVADGRRRWSPDELRVAMKLAGELCRRMGQLASIPHDESAIAFP